MSVEVVATNSTTASLNGESWEGNVGDGGGIYSKPPMGLIITSLSLSFSSVVSQTLVILISIGLEGDFSAQTIMAAQALFEMMKQSINILRASCGLFGGLLCQYHRVDFWCKISEAIITFSQSLPDYLNCLLALDRLVAVRYANWYKTN